MNDPDRTPAGSPNRTRDHLANERTFLAWTRTALALIGLGFVLARMGLFLRQLATLGADPGHPRSFPPGREFMATGVVVLVLGTLLAGWSAWLYHRVRRAIDTRSYEPADRSITILAATVVVGGLVIVGLIVWHVLASGWP